MGISDRIEAFILELMKQEGDGWLTIQRNELADIFGCVPSQINYVISTRFGADRGYEVKSKRGGGGCVRIKHSEPASVAVTASAAADEIEDLFSSGAISALAARLMEAAVTDGTLSAADDAGRIRRSILDSMKRALTES